MRASESDNLQKRLLDSYQRDMPISATPYADMAAGLGVSESEVLSALRTLNKDGVLSRVGPVYHGGKVGVSTLAAMQVPSARLQEVAALVSAIPEVNHNYEREHHFNLWFVITAATEMRLQQILDHIEDSTSLPVMALPMKRSYHIDLGFELQWD
jgi:Transcriptional regulators